MIEKFWNLREKDRNYDAIFQEAAGKMWGVWVEERNKEKYDLFDEVKWEKLFRCSPIVADRQNDSRIWTGLRFKDEGEYMLFLLEWG